MKHCCKNMEYYANHNNYLLEYDSSVRSYRFIIHGSSSGTHQILYYCPWCGIKLPKELDEEWEAILEKEYGIKEPGWKKTEELPEEFKTDEWWKKRGL